MQILPLLLTLSSVADARDADDSALADVYTHAGAVAAEGVVSLQLYACPFGLESSCIEVLGPDDNKYLFQVVPGDGDIVLSSAYSGAAGVELEEETLAKGPRLRGHLKRSRYKETLGELETLDLGGVVFSDLTVWAPEPSAATKKRLEEEGDNLRYGGTIGLNHFPDLSWALLRSQGVLKLSTGGGLLSEVAGTPVQAAYVPSFDVERESLGTIVTLPSKPLVVQGEIDGQPASIQLIGSGSSGVHRDRVAERDEDFLIGARSFHTLPVQAAGLTLNAAASEEGFAFFESDLGMRLGGDYLSAADWAFDAGSEQVALAWVKTDGRKGWNETLMAELAKGLTPEADPETGEVPDAPEGKALAGLQAGLARGHAIDGDPDARLASLRAAVEADPESCTVHHELGNTLLDYGQPIEAMLSLQKAGELWDAWDQIDPWEKDSWRLWLETLEEGSLKARLTRSLTHTYKLQWRENVEEGLMIYWVGGQMAEREEAGLEPNIRIQPNSCGNVWGDLAGALAATSDLAGVNALYAERLDYDAWVAVAAGNARLASGDAAGANEAYRQALKLGSQSGRFGMALIQLETGNKDAALDNMSDLVWHRGGDLDWLRRYYLAQASVNGPAAAADEMARRAEAWPENPSLRLAAAEAGLHAGRDASGWVQRAIKAYEFELMGPVESNEYRAQYAAALLLDGRVDDARASANKALARDPAQSTALTTLGMIAALEGDTDSAKALMERARVAGIWDPAYAVMRAN